MKKTPGRARRTDDVRPAYTCPDPGCGARVFLDREQAKAAIRQKHRGAGTLRPYPSCDGQGFHIGNLDPAVIAGEASRDDVYGPRRQA